MPREGAAAADRYTAFSVVSGTTATTLGSKSKEESDGVNIRQWTQDMDFRQQLYGHSEGERQAELGAVEGHREVRAA